jgi:hypothetical protein
VIGLGVLEREGALVVVIVHVVETGLEVIAIEDILDVGADHEIEKREQ